MLKKKYKLLSRLGDGGYGEVWLAESRKDQNQVALKRVKRGIRHRGEAENRLRLEIDATSKMKHPNIMPLLDHGNRKDWYTMPVAEDTLEHAASTMTHLELYHCIRDVCTGLAYAHSKDILHRDIHPGNIYKIYQNEKPVWVLGDWGLVKHSVQNRGFVTKKGDRIGVEQFQAPEVNRSPSNASKQSDLYSLGRVMAWAVTGKYPMSNILSTPSGPWQAPITNSTLPNNKERISDAFLLIEQLDLMPRTFDGFPNIKPNMLTELEGNIPSQTNRNVDGGTLKEVTGGFEFYASPEKYNYSYLDNRLDVIARGKGVFSLDVNVIEGSRPKSFFFEIHSGGRRLTVSMSYQGPNRMAVIDSIGVQMSDIIPTYGMPVFVEYDMVDDFYIRIFTCEDKFQQALVVEKYTQLGQDCLSFSREVLFRLGVLSTPGHQARAILRSIHVFESRDK